MEKSLKIGRLSNRKNRYQRGAHILVSCEDYKVTVTMKRVEVSSLIDI